MIGILALAITAACVASVTEYSSEAADAEAEAEGEGDPSETETGDDGAPGDGDGEPGDGDGDGDPGDGDGDPGDGDGDGEPGCKPGACEPGYECVEEVCTLSDYPWGKCGWNPEGYYACSHQGESPDPKFPIDCGELPLIPDAPCPEGLTFEGCCSYGGDNWWCDDGFVQRDVCGG